MDSVSFGTWDYVIVGVVLLISSAIGIYYRFTGGKQKTVQEYLLADKNMPITPVACSLMASFMSAITILGVSSENYTFGFQFVVINLSYLVFTPVAAYLYLPVFFKLQATSVYQYLELRFGKTTRLAASICYTLQMVLYMGVVVYAPSLALEALTGINRVSAILSMGLVCSFYSTIGGMKAVLMTDVFQSILMFLGVFSIIGAALLQHGSFGEIWRIAAEGNRTDIWNFDPDPTVRHSWFTLIIGGGVMFLSLYGVNQTQTQRYLTVRNLKRAQAALWLNWPITFCLGLATSFSGLAIFSKYHHCDPIKAGYINNTDQLMPYFVVDTMGHIPGLAGLFVAGIFSASLSTISAALNCLAAVTMEDYYKPLYKLIAKKELPPQTIALQTKLLSVFYGGICIAFAFIVQYLGSVLSASLIIFGVVGGPLLGLFSLGMFTFIANEVGSVVGLACGLSLGLWMGFAPKPAPVRLPTLTDGCEAPVFNITMAASKTVTNNSSDYFWLYRVSYLYNGLFGFLTTFVIGYVASLIVRTVKGKWVKDENYDPNLFIQPLSKKLLVQQENNKLSTLFTRADLPKNDGVQNSTGTYTKVDAI
ncbi:putative sodium-dependent multivitamin transporter isoform X2 [Rhynchophorus ferrugineus]|uniref:putative sodium-dependent multivitamin transporter isoform X2 n=1 Tax=Rhynchophorus ferrugineus TaxID=354439 RepID=UPI003FCCCFF3